MSARAQCAETRRLVQLREEDRISREESSALLAHVSTCSACRREALTLAPELCFALAEAGRQPVSPEEAQRVASDVVSALEVGRVRQRLGSSSGRRRALLVAASIGLVALGATLYVKRPGASGHRAIAAASVPAPRAEVVPASRPILEGVASPGATIYQFAAGSREEPAVVFVVDRNADL